MDVAGRAFLREIDDVGVNQRFPAGESDVGNAEVSKFIDSRQPFLFIDELPGSLLPDVAEAAFSNAYIGNGKFCKAHGTVQKRLEYVFVFWVHRSSLGAPEWVHRSRQGFPFCILVSMNCTSNRLPGDCFLAF